MAIVAVKSVAEDEGGGEALPRPRADPAHRVEDILEVSKSDRIRVHLLTATNTGTYFIRTTLLFIRDKRGSSDWFVLSSSSSSANVTLY